MSCRYRMRRSIAALVRYILHRSLAATGAWTCICTLEPGRSAILQLLPTFRSLSHSFWVSFVAFYSHSFLRRVVDQLFDFTLT